MSGYSLSERRGGDQRALHSSLWSMRTDRFYAGCANNHDIDETAEKSRSMCSMKCGGDASTYDPAKRIGRRVDHESARSRAIDRLRFDQRKNE